MSSTGHSQASAHSCCRHNDVGRRNSLFDAVLKTIRLARLVWASGRPVPACCDHCPRCVCRGHMAQEVAQALCEALSLRVRVRGDQSSLRREGLLICSNHISYVDVPILLANFAGSPVASAKIYRSRTARRWRRKFDIVPAEQGSPRAAMATVADISARLSAGKSVIAFPEGVTSDGNPMSPFKRGVFEAAVRTGADVLPVMIAVQSMDAIGGRALDVRDFYWYRDRCSGRRQRLGRHVFRLAHAQTIDVRLLCGTPISPDGHDRSSLAAATRAAMLELTL
ncbi:lysophospholipid acyltransferase family protein [Streptomyces sp. NPDC055287]